MRKSLAAITVILFSLLLALGVAEGGVRLFHLARPAENPGWFFKVPDALTGWGHIANSQGRWFNEMYEFDTYVSYNSREVRAPESLGYEKPADVYRVMVLGDSFVEALQVNLERTFFQGLGDQLARAALASDQRIEVMGVGAGGWGTDQALLWFENEGVNYQPDAVILAVFPSNDFMDNTESLDLENRGGILKPFFALEDGDLALRYFPFDPESIPQPALTDTQAEAEAEAPAPAAEPQADPPLTAWGDWLYEHSALYRYLDPRVRVVSPGFARWLAQTGVIKPGAESKTDMVDPTYVPVAYGIYAQPLDPTWQGSVELTTALFARLKASAEASGATFGAVVISAQEQVYDHQWQRILERFPVMRERAWDPLQANRLAEQALADAGVPTLNLLPLFQDQAQAGAVLHFPQDGHWTVYGHELVSAALFNFVGEAGLIPAAVGQHAALPSPLAQRSLWDWFVIFILALLVVSLAWSIAKNGPVRWGRDVGGRLGTAGELMAYMVHERQFLLLPLVVILLLFGGLLIVAQASVVGPFIYTLF